MSTTFGVRIPSTDEVVEIARRVGAGNGNVNVYFTKYMDYGLFSWIMFNGFLHGLFSSRLRL